MNQPLLRFLITKNYKNLSLEQVVELQKLNIFIGANNSGKSNFISCLKFLKSSLTKIPDENRGVSSFEDAMLFPRCDIGKASCQVKPPYAVEFDKDWPVLRVYDSERYLIA